MTWFPLCGCVYYWTHIFVLIEVIICHTDIWLVEMHYLLFCWYYIVHMYWHEIEYEQGSDKWRSSVLRSFCDYELGMWRSSVLEMIWFYDSALRSSAQARGNAPLITNSRRIYEKYLYIRLRDHMAFWCISSHDFALHLIISFILVWLCASLRFGWHLIIPFWWKLTNKYNVDL